MTYYIKAFLCYFAVMFVGFLIPPFVFPYIPISFLADWGIEWRQSAFGRAFGVGIMYACGMTWYVYKKKREVQNE